jgi:nicotinamidase-related amidase
MNIIDPARCVLVLVDYQPRLLPAMHAAPQMLAEVQALVDVARVLGLRIVGTEQNPAGLGPLVDNLRRHCETTLTKMQFNACAEGLLALLHPPTGLALPDVVIAGCEAHICLMQTALGLLWAGHRVWVIAPACGSRSPADHELAMQRLRQAGAVIASVEMVVFEWLQSCRHEHFKTLLPLIKARVPGLGP